MIQQLVCTSVQRRKWTGTNRWVCDFIVGLNRFCAMSHWVIQQLVCASLAEEEVDWYNQVCVQIYCWPKPLL
jgi:hypothetical protein